MHRSIRKTLGLLAVAMGCAVPSFAHADTVTATLTTVDPYVFGNVYLQGSGSLNGGIGQIVWAGSSANNVPFNGTFDTFCIDLIQDINFGSTYTYTTGLLQNGPNSAAYPSGTPTTGMGVVKADEIEALYGMHYTDIQGPDTAAVQTDKEAFQLAIWNIVYDTDASVSTGNGSFYATSNVASGAITQANTYLADALNPADQQFDQQNLIALMGQNGAQDQIAVNPLIPSTITQAAPLPGSGPAGVVLLAACGYLKWRRQAAMA